MNYSQEELNQALKMIRNLRAQEANAVSSSEKLAAQMDEYRYEDQEHFVVFALNAQNKIIAAEALFVGGINSVNIDPRVIGKFLLENDAAAFAIGHNHPSGNLQPSTGDIMVTRSMAAMGDLLRCKLIDHIIVSTAGHYSFADEGAPALDTKFKL